MKKFNKKKARIRRALNSRSKIKKNKINRLLVHRTNRHIYAQITNPSGSKTLVSSCSLKKNNNNQKQYTGNKKTAKTVGQNLALKATKKGIKKIAFDRSGFKYHGRIKELAKSARKFGLEF